jgi:hypothetical protein
MRARLRLRMCVRGGWGELVLLVLLAHEQGGMGRASYLPSYLIRLICPFQFVRDSS